MRHFQRQGPVLKDVGGSDAKIVVLARKKDHANTKAMREKMSCFNKLKISADAISLVRGSEGLDARDKRAGTGGIVNVSKSLFDRQNGKTLGIDGTSSKSEAVQAGKYQFYDEGSVAALDCFPRRGQTLRGLCRQRGRTQNSDAPGNRSRQITQEGCIHE